MKFLETEYFEEFLMIYQKLPWLFFFFICCFSFHCSDLVDQYEGLIQKYRNSF